MNTEKDLLVQQIAEAMQDTLHETFINIKNLRLIIIPSGESEEDITEEQQKLYAENQKEYDNNEFDYIDVPVADSDENYKLMKLFANNITDAQVKSRLLIILSEAKPFKFFKTAIESREELHEQWKLFRQKYFKEKAETFLKQEMT